MEDGLKNRYMITERAKYKAKILIFWEKHGLKSLGSPKMGGPIQNLDKMKERIYNRGSFANML